MSHVGITLRKRGSALYETFAIVSSSALFLGTLVDHVLMRKSISKHAAATELAQKNNQSRLGELFKRVKGMQLGWHEDMTKTQLFSGNSHLIDRRTGLKFDTSMLDGNSTMPPPPFHDFQIEFSSEPGTRYDQRALAELSYLRQQLGDEPAPFSDVIPLFPKGREANER